jgi:hypothetical protein
MRLAPRMADILNQRIALVTGCEAYASAHACSLNPALTLHPRIKVSFGRYRATTLNTVG